MARRGNSNDFGGAVRAGRCAMWRPLALALCGALAASAGDAATYYFSSLGHDALGNGSLAKPWKSVDKFNTINLNPGDSALFRAGDQFTGRLWLDANDSGANAAGALISPVTIGSYGAIGATTRATIVAPPNSEAFVAYNNGGIALSNLEFAGGGGATRTNGVRFLADSFANGSLHHYQHIRVSNVASRGFGLSGLELWAHRTVGYADVQISDSDFSDNGYAGLNVAATNWQNLLHQNVLVDRVQAHHNPGYAGADPHSGHGIVMAEVDGGVIQNSVAHDNGLAHGAGNVGIWTYQSNNVAIQGNVAYGNRSPAGFDGGGFDIDGGVTNSVVQYNRSYDNEGAGLLLAQFQNADDMSHNVFRYNLSVNDGRGEYGGITVWGYGNGDLAQGAVFHNNTVVVDRNVAPDAKGAVYFMGANHDDVALLNNAFVALNGAALIAGDTSIGKSAFVGNSYWTAGGPIVLEDAAYATVQAWSSATLQERSGAKFVGVTDDPQFVDAATFRLQGESPLADAARAPGTAPWPSWVTSLGQQDLGGAPLDLDSPPEIGAWEILAADLTGDSQVEGLDLEAWRAAFGHPAPAALLGDVDRDGDADGADFLLWQRSVNAATATGFVQPIPEPAAAALAGLMLPLFTRNRRQPRSAARNQQRASDESSTAVGLC